MTATILVTGAGGPAGYSVINAFKSQKDFKIKLIAVDANPLTAAFYFSDKSYVVPLAQSADFIQAVEKICRKENVNYIIPTVTEELLKFAISKNAFEKMGVKVVISNETAIRRCIDKWETHKFFSTAGIPHPKTYLRLGKKMRFPILIKPRFGRGSRDIYLADKNTIEIFLKKVEKPILQEYVEGTEYTIDTLSDFNAKAVAAVPRERIEVKAGISYKGRTVSSAELVEYATKIVEALKIVGPSNIQCIRKNDKFLFTEVNPRFSGGLPLTIAAGVNTPLMLLKMLEGEKIKPVFAYKKNLVMLRYFAEVFREE